MTLVLAHTVGMLGRHKHGKAAVVKEMFSSFRISLCNLILKSLGKGKAI